MLDFACLREKTRGLLSINECEELAHWGRLAKGGRALEVGHYTGLSTCVLLESLPTGTVLYSIDHHNGDNKVPKSTVAEFELNIQESLDKVSLVPVYQDFRKFWDWGISGFGLVFYDAEHTEQACIDFWTGLRGKFSPGCILLYDDADWEEMKPLGRMAEAAGFQARTRLPIRRLKGDKRNSETYTLKVLQFQPLSKEEVTA